MEIYKTKDNKVTKYVHNNGSETAIKIENSCSSIFNPLTKKIESTEKYKNKFVVFISHSVGCNIKCKHCYLTTKNFPYRSLSHKEIVYDVIEALSEQLKITPEIKDKYCKISWMGMGDIINNSHVMVRTTNYLLNFIDAKFKGLDSIDIASTLCEPVTVLKTNLKDDLIYDIVSMKCFIDNDDININKKDESIRFFYSLMGTNDKTRPKIIPKSSYIIEDFNTLELLYNKGVKIILHHLFIDGINDSPNDIKDLISLCNGFPMYELRVLRYNKCDKSKFQESSRFMEIIEQLNSSVPNLKFQISTGSEIKAACGQFIME